MRTQNPTVRNHHNGAIAVNWAFTLTELLVVIAIVGMIAALLLPVFTKARQRARMTTCLSNLRQIGLATRAYENDYDGNLPPINPYGSYFSDETYVNGAPRDPLAPFGTSPALYHCAESQNPWSPPAAEYGDYCTRFDLYFVRVDSPNGQPYVWRIQPESDTVLVYCPAEVNAIVGCQDASAMPHTPGEMFQALRGDGSVKRVPAWQVKFRTWDFAPFVREYTPPLSDGSGPYAQFPGESWPPTLTALGKAK